MKKAKIASRVWNEVRPTLVRALITLVIAYFIMFLGMYFSKFDPVAFHRIIEKRAWEATKSAK